VSSGQGVVAGVTVIRVSGPQAGPALRCLLGSGDAEQPFPKPRYAAVRRLIAPGPGGEELDEALVLWMPGPRSFTGQDVVELHCHGSRAVVAGVLGALEATSDVLLSGSGDIMRMAEPGEFTRQAFSNGRMDLAQVEGLADLLAADTSAQRKQALEQMKGALSTRYAEWRKSLVKCLAHAEAVLDFGDDEDDVVEDQVYNDLVPRVRALRDELESALLDGHRGEIVRDGAALCIVGAPNAGKSSLLNQLARRPAAIVSPVAGTTRDIVEVVLDLGGIPVTIADTAGLRGLGGGGAGASSGDGEDAPGSDIDPIEMEGMKRAISRIDDAQIVVAVADVTDENGSLAALSAFAPDGAAAGGAAPQDVAAAALRDLQTTSRKVVLIGNKVDLLESWNGEAAKAAELPAWVQTLAAESGLPVVPLSCTGTFGVADLEGRLADSVQWLMKGDGADDEVALITRSRHRGHVARCTRHLDAFLSLDLPLDLAAEELRSASLELGRVTGAVDVEDLLDVIFRDFCIGK